MRSYQSTLIFKPDLDEAQVDQALEKVTGFLSKFNGSCLKVEKWGKKRLAYRIKKSRFGYYLNIYHTCDRKEVSHLETEYKLYDLILKYLVIRLDDKELTRAMSREYESDSDEKRDKPSDKKEVATSVAKEDTASDKKEDTASDKKEVTASDKKEDEPSDDKKVKDSEEKDKPKEVVEKSE